MSTLFRRFLSLACIGMIWLISNDAAAQHSPPNAAAVNSGSVNSEAIEKEAIDEGAIEAGVILEQPIPEAFDDSTLAASGYGPCSQDRVFLVSTRHLCFDACRAKLDQIPFRIWRIDSGNSVRIEPADYGALLSPDRPVVIYVHGNRMPPDEVIVRSRSVRCEIKSRCRLGPLDWVVFSWPSERETLGVRDFREKADRCDAQGLYLAALMRTLTERSVPMAVIGYSFGARVATGALHALAGGKLGGRHLPETPVTNAGVQVGLIAPAIESNWLDNGGYHSQATKNMNQLVLLYNRRDVVLKRYWLLEKVRRETALGYSGPSSFAARFDGTRLPVRSRDCSPSVRIRHAELDYYQKRCNAGCEMARLIQAMGSIHF